MLFSAYILDRIGYLLLLAFTLVLAIVAMLLHGLSIFVLSLVIGLVALCSCVTVCIDFMRVRAYYEELNAFSQSLGGKAYLASALNTRPRTCEQQLVYAIMQRMTRAATAYIDAYKLEQGNYQHYIEMWVHEVKTPLAACNLMLHNAAATNAAHAANAENAANTRVDTPHLPRSAASVIAQQHAITSRIELQINRIEELVDQALYYARSSNVEHDFIIKEIELSDVVRAAIQAYSKHMIMAHITPRLSNITVRVRSDPKWLQFMIEQIFSNAIKYRKPTNDASYLYISATQTHDTMGVSTTTLSIRDEGIGIPQGDCAHVFEQAFTGENGRAYAKSTGMGLFLVDKLARNMGMRVSIASRVGEGTTLTLHFSSSLNDII